MSNRNRASAWARPLVLLAVGLAWIGGQGAHAGDLNAPFALDTADTLPANVRNPRFIDIFASVSSRFSDSGSKEGLGQPLNKIVTGRDVLTEQEDSAKRNLVRGIFKANNIDEGAALGATTGEVNTFADVKVAALAWGITDKLTIAGVLPIIHIDVSASTGFAVSSESANNHQSFMSALSRSETPLTAQEATNQFNDAVNRKLLRLGYEPIPASETISGVGDAQFIGKYRLYNDGVNGVALKGTLIFPTGTAPDPDKALDIPTGDGRLGAGLAGVYDRKLLFNLRWNSYLSYTAMLPHHIVKRIPTSVDDPLSADKEEMYERTRSLAALGTGVDWYVPPAGLILGAGYAFQYLTRADYEPGSTYAQDRYYLLGDQQPLETLHSVLVSAGFSTVDWYQRKKFVYPMQVNVSYTHPFAGRNVPSGDLVAGELVVFF